jgi:hypothetical protein
MKREATRLLAALLADAVARYSGQGAVPIRPPAGSSGRPSDRASS